MTPCYLTCCVLWLRRRVGILPPSACTALSWHWTPPAQPCPGLKPNTITIYQWIQLIDPWGIWLQSQISKFQTHFNDKYLMYFLWNCYQVNATTPHWSLVNTDSGNGLVPSGNKPLPEPMLPKISNAIWWSLGPWKCGKLNFNTLIKDCYISSLLTEIPQSCTEPYPAQLCVRLKLNSIISS